MSYQVIARKWRPRDFTELVGQEHVSQTLLNALRHDRLHHALLFTGPRGTGKTSSARILAKALRCPNAKDFVPCHVCPECEEIASGRSVNVVEMDGASNNGVDAIRELRDTVGYMPSSGRFKLYIIDEVHMLSTSAFNALLKTLEEPPGHVIFVMATTEVQKIPETVLSRVQRFDFRCIPTRMITEHLKAICSSEGIEFEPEALWTIARQGAGSMRDSQSFLDQAVTFAGGALTLQKVIDVLGLTDRRLLLRTATALVKRNPQEILTVLKEVFYAGYDPRLFVQDLLEELRHLLMIKLLPQGVGSVVDLPDSELAELKALSEHLSAEDIHLLFDMALKAAGEVPRAPDPKVILEMALLRMAAAPRIANLIEWMKSGPSPSSSSSSTAGSAVPQAHRPLPTTPAPVPPPAAPAASANPPSPTVTASAAPKNWFDLVKQIHSVNSVIGAQLENCFLKELKDNHIILGVSPKMKFLFDKLNEPEFKKKVLNYVTTFWGPGFQLEVTQAQSEVDGKLTPKEMAKKEAEDHRQQVIKQVTEHPLIKSAQEIFKTEIRAIKENKA